MGKCPRCLRSWPLLHYPVQHENFGEAGFDNVYNFTFAAWNTTSPNANITAICQTYASYPYIDYKSFSLVNGALYIDDRPAGGIPSLPVEDSAIVEFFRTNSEPEALRPSARCDVCLDVDRATQADTDPNSGSPYAAIAVNNDLDHWLLCLRSGTSWWSVSYMLPNQYQGYDVDSCYPIRLQIIQSD
ncbi:hypothetical protein OBBRIDRAFT_804323 [Obba rivulosa]|uniref:Uncharacterized protein n=1 Tax=Obba rivulosa TaxID=1052685 RepID=A0A8E2AXG6_9APHY|nr:hypothetical protein OBBRIDRAFT_804323 [Obba rivulosa]